MIPRTPPRPIAGLIAAALLAPAAAAQESPAAPASPTAGYDGRFFIASPEPGFRLNVIGDIQFRYHSTFDADDPAENVDDDFEGGFQLRRTRLDVRGTTLNNKVEFRVLSSFSRSDGRLELQDAWASYAFDGGAKLLAGQFKLPFTREFDVGSIRQLAVERSIADEIFRLDRSQGLMLSREWDRVRVAGAFSDGRRTVNSAYTDDSEADFAFTGRFEARLGEAGWRQFRDFMSFRGGETGVLLGLAGHWQQGGATASPAALDDEADLFAYTADASIEGDGWNIFAAFYGRHIEAGDETYDDLGFTVQAGVFVTEHHELFARYSAVFPDDDRSGGTDSFSEITAGVNWYFIPESHALKVTLQAQYYPEPTTDASSLISTPNTSIGILPDADSGQLAVVAQLQLLF